MNQGVALRTRVRHHFTVASFCHVWVLPEILITELDDPVFSSYRFLSADIYASLSKMWRVLSFLSSCLSLLVQQRSWDASRGYLLLLPGSPYSASCSFHQAECWRVNMLVITAYSSVALLCLWQWISTTFPLHLSQYISSTMRFNHFFIVDVSWIVIALPLLCLWFTLYIVNAIYNENVTSLLDHRAASLHIFKRMPQSLGNVAFNCACFQINLHPQLESKSLPQSSVLGFRLKHLSTAYHATGWSRNVFKSVHFLL